MDGKGDLKLTGSMGDVMRESVEAARSWLRNHARDYALEPMASTHDDSRPRSSGRGAEGWSVRRGRDGVIARVAVDRTCNEAAGRNDG